MNVLLDDQQKEIQQALGDFLAAECTPALVRAAEKNPARFSRPLWDRLAELGWLGLCLPETHGGQGLPLTYMALLLEEVGRAIAPMPVHSTLVTALVIAKHGSDGQRAMLAEVARGQRILSYAVTEKSGRWLGDAIELAGRIEGDTLVLWGQKRFADDFQNAAQCLVAFRLQGVAGGGVAAALVDTSAPGITVEALGPTAKDSESAVRFEGVRIPLASVVGDLAHGVQVVADLMDYAAVFLACQMQGAARRTMEFAVEYVNSREAFGQPIGAFQAIQHMAADMLNAVDGTQLLAREAVWKLGEGLPAQVEVSQAKSFANEKCMMVCRCAQQMHGGIGFILEFDLNLWYRRVTSWSLRAGTTYEHRARIADALLANAHPVRLGGPLQFAENHCAVEAQREVN
jgi:alkylation response protein AidB-like acyl-CoA dehydrogenase